MCYPCGVTISDDYDDDNDDDRLGTHFARGPELLPIVDCSYRIS